MSRFLFILFFSLFYICYGQTYWQQHVDYKMDVHMNVKKFQYDGSQTIIYTNNSPDTLHTIYFHLFYNAFRPGSEMSARIMSAKDKNHRFRVNIDSLTEQEMGFLKVVSIFQDGVPLSPEESETILEVKLNAPLLPNSSTTLVTKFKGQVPKLIRRGGAILKKMSR